MLKKFITHSLIGLGIAYLITTFWIFITPAQEASAAAFIWGIAAIIYSNSAIIYDYQALPKALSIHFTCSLITTLVACKAMSLVIGFEMQLGLYLAILLNFLIVYLIIVLANIYSAKRQSRLLNEMVTKHQK